MANAGVGLDPNGSTNAPYYQAVDQKSLIDAFGQIIDGARSCVFTLNGEVKEGSAESGKVVLDGETLGYGDPDGWKLNNPKEIELTGAACDKIQQGEHTLSVSFPCDGVTLDPK